MPTTENRLLRVAAARADFLDSGRDGAAGMPDVLAASWERSQAAGVRTESARTDYDAEFDSGSLLVRCARPVLQRIGVDAADIPLVIAVTDQKARVVQRIDSSSSVGRLLDRVEFAPGFNYSESAVGTNGVGTVLEAGQAISIVGPEHFTDALQPFACSGAPIIDPVSGRVEGVVDISCLTQTWSPLMHTLVKSAAADISRNLLLDRSQSQQAIFDTYLQATSRAPRQAVFAFGEAIFVANNPAQAMFDAQEQQTIRNHASFLMRRHAKATDSFVLPSGRVVRIRGTRIVSGGELAGMVVLAEVVTSQRPETAEIFSEHVLPEIAVATQRTSKIAGGLSRAPETIADGRSPAWVRACDELREALGDGQSALVMGETGTGKFTLAAEIFHLLFPGGRSVSVDAGQLNTWPELDDLDSLLAGQAESTLVIVRNLDQADTEGTENLDSLLSAARRADVGARVVATVSDASLDSDLPFRSLLSHFEVAVAVPPLRLRSEDIPAITSMVLRELEAARTVRLSPGAERLIARYSWPRNVTQLREALKHALRKRPVGEIQEQDLPAYCHTTSRRSLTPLESAERDAIIAALAEQSGNRVAAAAHLGMSRSTLYRKISTYGITA
ncbi:sigma-54-dependent Fis family transcriptional regulator [Amycolatopsis benzoatilytica]|uniref:sigma-54-dependent Fis family transcriptional regulator n=1 Tax=Amycolatopsis benzoatilytica TaxID=346045 RepID=UPI0003827ED0|nr:helix-turn-helix domain-containing protein [Amycolatopsis benzoatilytica]